MHMLRDALFTFEACLPADVRRPRMRLERFDAQWTLDVVRSLGRDEANLRILGALVEEATGRTLEGKVLTERFAELVVCGRILLREVEALDVYPLPDPRFEHRSLTELAEEELLDDAEAPRSWISLELLHAAGLSTARLEVEVTTASGREVHGRLDAKGRWRCDDVEAGSCSVRLLEHPVLLRQRQRRRAQLSRQRPQRGDLVWPAGSEPRLELRAAEHHRIVIVPPVVPYCPSA
jgi:hypothetical protein